VRLLVDIVLPRDDRSGSATDAGVPEFMDFMMLDQPARQVAMRGGLAWLDAECEQRFDTRFIDCADAQRTAVLDDIAWPSRAVDASGRIRPELQHGVAFFNSFRDLTATGYWTSKMGIEDLRYMGNRAVRWNGCPDEALKKLGVSY
jgi:gluconate 2-dehydrogenase gamma chain